MQPAVLHVCCAGETAVQWWVLAVLLTKLPGAGGWGEVMAVAVT